MTTPQGQVPEAIAGALFDFAGFLTTLPKERAVTLSGAHLATPVVDLLTEWAKTRGLNLDEANVKGWEAALTAAPANTNTASGAADDSLQLCASDLQHSAIYDNHAEMQSCMRAVADRITALASAPAQPVPSPTAGMSIAQRILHVGGRNNAAGYVEFGSTQAVEALVHQVLRDLPEQQPSPTPQADSQPAPVLDERVAFEVWARDTFYSGMADVADSRKGSSYSDMAHHMAWYAYQAGRAALAQADSVQEDAARYRWIRGPVEESTRYSRWRIEYWDGKNGWQPMQREIMDSAIDTARKQGGA